MSAGSLCCLDYVGKLIALAAGACFTQALIKREAVMDQSEERLSASSGSGLEMCLIVKNDAANSVTLVERRPAQKRG